MRGVAGGGMVRRRRTLLLEHGLSLLLHANGLLMRDTTSAGQVIHGVGHMTTCLKLPRSGLRVSMDCAVLIIGIDSRTRSFSGFRGYRGRNVGVATVSRIDGLS